MKTLKQVLNTFGTYAVVALVVAGFAIMPFGAGIGSTPTAEAANVDDVVVNEIMVNPSAVSDADGEWIELHNTSGSSIDLTDWTIRVDTDGNGSTSGDQYDNIFSGKTISAGGYFVICSNDDMSQNGGVDCDDDYSFSLNNSSSHILLYDNDSSDSIYKIEDVAYNTTQGGGLDTPGQSMVYENGSPSTYNESTYGDGDYGTPGSENSAPASNSTPVPSAPTLDTPVDNATTTADVTLEWTQTDDGSFPNHDDSDYYYYYVEVASTSQFLSGDLVGNFGSELDTEIDQSGLSAGTYYWRVRATHDPDGDNDASNAVVSDFSETRSFTVENQSTGTTPTGTISGSKWIYGPNDGEAGVGWEIMLYEQGEVYSLMSTTTTDTAGEYSFTELPYGDYLVCEESRDGFEQQFPNSDNSQSGDCVEEGNTGYLITINDDNQAVENKLFGNLPVEPRPLFTFSGTKSDADANGLDGWEFQLIVMSDGPEYTDIVATTTTDIYGYYEFEIYYEDLPGWAKEYPPIFLQESYVREVLQDGWEQVNVKLDDETLPERPEYELEEQVCYLTSEYFEIQPAEEGEAVDLKNSADCDFVNTQTTDEEEVEEEEDSSGGGGGSSSTGTRTDRFNDSSTVTTTPTPEPQVLGETTTNFCPFLTEYMQMGVQNDVMEVTKLQLFLNVFKSVYGGVENPITGTFGTMTDANVKAFQQHYSSEILDPWFARGIVPHNRPTGFVYKTTMWKINSMVCPDETVEPEFEGEDLNSNVAVN